MLLAGTMTSLCYWTVVLIQVAARLQSSISQNSHDEASGNTTRNTITKPIVAITSPAYRDDGVPLTVNLLRLPGLLNHPSEGLRHPSESFRYLSEGLSQWQQDDAVSQSARKSRLSQRRHSVHSAVSGTHSEPLVNTSRSVSSRADGGLRGRGRPVREWSGHALESFSYHDDAPVLLRVKGHNNSSHTTVDRTSGNVSDTARRHSGWRKRSKPAYRSGNLDLAIDSAENDIFIAFNKSSFEDEVRPSLNYPLRPPTPEIVPLDDVTKVYDVAGALPNRTSLPGDPKRPFFELATSIDAHVSLDSSRSSVLRSSADPDDADVGLRCYTCAATVPSDRCYAAPDGNTTGWRDGEDRIPSRQCGSAEHYCRVSRVWFVTKTGDNKTEHQFSVERSCSAKCEPYCIMMGDRTRIEIFACATCCDTSNCNTGSGVPRGPVPTPLQTGVVLGGLGLAVLLRTRVLDLLG